MGDDRQLQRTLLRSMLVAGELSLAAQHQQLFGLSGEFEIHPERLAEEQERRRQQFLQLPLPAAAVRYVDCAQGLAAMQAALAALLAAPHRHGSAHSPVGACGDAHPAAAAAALASPQAAEPAAGPAAAAGSAALGTPPGSLTAAASDRDDELLPVLGIDLEWQPDSENSSPPSVLQISTGTPRPRLHAACSPSACWASCMGDRRCCSAVTHSLRRHFAPASLLATSSRQRRTGVKPPSRRASQPRLDPLQATTLPLATADAEVFVVDLLALAVTPDSEAALAAALGPVLASEAVYKVGCGIAGDCRKLATHHPAAFAVTRGCVDLSATWRAYSVEQSEPCCLWAAALAGSRDLWIR